MYQIVWVMSSEFEGCSTNTTKEESGAQTASAGSPQMDKEAVYLVVMGSLGLVIILLVCIIICCAIRIHRMKLKPKKVKNDGKLHVQFVRGQIRLMNHRIMVQISGVIIPVLDPIPESDFDRF